MKNKDYGLIIDHLGDFRSIRLEPPSEDALDALLRLYKIAHSDTGQSTRVRRFLLGLYNGPEFPFDLTELRTLDRAIWDDCIIVLRLDRHPAKEIHEYLPEGRETFKRWALALAADKSEAVRQR